jgi:hypothetical protein
MFGFHISFVVQRKLPCVRLHSPYEKDAITEKGKHALEEILRTEVVKTCSGRAELREKLLRCRIFVSTELQRCECSGADHGLAILRRMRW